jgi:hypothetical protein
MNLGTITLIDLIQSIAIVGIIIALVVKSKE